MRRLIIGLIVVAAVPAMAQKHTHRQHSAHEHGAGALNIALEGNKLEIELVAPADDIVGFEHTAKTKAQKAAVANAKTTLGDPLAVFKPSSDAQCTPTTVQVKFENEGEGKGGHNNETKSVNDQKAKSGHDHKKKSGHDHKGEDHAEVRATYTFTCEQVSKLTRMELPYFARFPRSSRLTINFISSKGQSKITATRKTKSISLKNRL